MRNIKVSVRDQDRAVWERAQEAAEAQYLPFSRFLTKVLAEYLAGRWPDQPSTPAPRPNGQETP